MMSVHLCAPQYHLKRAFRLQEDPDFEFHAAQSISEDTGERIEQDTELA